MKVPCKIIMETPRLILSDFETADFNEFCRIFDELERTGQEWFNVRTDRPETIRQFFFQILDDQQERPRHSFRFAVRLKTASSTPEIIGYAAICDIYSNLAGKPDTGVLIQPQYQGSGYARESRVAISYFSTLLGLKKLIAEIKTTNLASIENVIGMGYEQLYKGDDPLIVKMDTVRGIENWYRFRITREKILEYLPGLLNSLGKRYWQKDVSHLCKAKAFDEIIKVHALEMSEL